MADTAPAGTVIPAATPVPHICVSVFVRRGAALVADIKIDSSFAFVV